jgi:hypothetical protein
MLTTSLRSIDKEHLEFLPKSALSGGLDFQHNWKKRKYFFDVKSFFSRVAGSEEAIEGLQLASQHYFQREDAGHLDFDPGRTDLAGHGGQLQGGKRSGKFRATGTFSWRSPGVNLNDIGYLYQADYLEENIMLRYQVNKPKGILRDYYYQLTQNHQWSYGGETTKEKVELHTYFKYTNLWRSHLVFGRDYHVFDTRELRGGPKLYKDDTWYGQVYVQSNNAKDVMVGAGPVFSWADDGISKRNKNTFFVRWQINDRMTVTTQTDYEISKDYHEYIRKVSLSDSNNGYLVGQLNRETLQTTLRLEYFVTPEISLQYYANPYASVGKYSNFRKVGEGSSKDINKRYLTPQTNFQDNTYTLDFGEGETHTFDNPDFNYQEFRSNLVARWEFRTGSTLYLVWNSSKYLFERQGAPAVTGSYKDIFGLDSSNVFMIKFNYWFSL